MSPVPSGEIIERAVRLSGRAPSLHNSQPWQWVFDGTALRLYSVRGRMLPSTDESGRQMLISCGAALGHLRAALSSFGWHTRVAYFPNPTRHEHLATVTFAEARIVTDADRERAAAIERRRTDRLPFGPPANRQDLEIVLRIAIDEADAVLTVLPDAARPELAHASRLSAALRRYDADYQAELLWWTGHSFGSAGIPPTSRLSAAEQARVEVNRTFPTVTDADRRAATPVDAALVVALSTGDSPTEWVRCGVALSTLLLECTVLGFATCPLTHLTELPHSRAVIRTVTGSTEPPQVLVRIGTVPADERPPRPTPRLPLAQILSTIIPSHTG
ncbi:NAD(P)H nitroreductase [Nocardia sp. SYP-A9097]|uniref:Acg family FMN-binding oxidoreductase n=1 Tax=Nocardia sp. SYP-A9097 TaxID=2663237 RepID=UPI00129BD7E0|nr:NAD(P)H nitroreductase [Nocardia sp. SYP-A9097]MRH87625.1 NAD(P)H nitroreductase [Nocardia sp. SYP-A9097]